MVLLPVFLFADSEHLVVNRFLCVCQWAMLNIVLLLIFIFFIVCVCE